MKRFGQVLKAYGKEECKIGRNLDNSRGIGKALRRKGAAEEWATAKPWETAKRASQARAAAEPASQAPAEEREPLQELVAPSPSLQGGVSPRAASPELQPQHPRILQEIDSFEPVRARLVGAMQDLPTLDTVWGGAVTPRMGWDAGTFNSYKCFLVCCI